MQTGCGNRVSLLRSIAIAGTTMHVVHTSLLTLFASLTSLIGRLYIPTIPLFCVDLTLTFVIIYFGFVLFHRTSILQLENGGHRIMATKTNFILKVQDSKLADIQKALKDANITVVSILEIHKEEA